MAALSWLAAFHAFFWGRPRPDGLWQQGTFWHLDTRQEELENVSWRELKDNAQAVGEPMGFEHPLGRSLSSSADARIVHFAPLILDIRARA
jgi:hypothetical protein